ncbi:MAG: hypothetical protein BWZ10_03440 [candidate division BRC1 bacterium ADurb.BinA364]|nr:MAG: hypothetical protein BWZ10_03440 [candidate division BRC1 bacterium ADurb.BinA364]
MTPSPRLSTSACRRRSFSRSASSARLRSVKSMPRQVTSTTAPLSSFETTFDQATFRRSPVRTRISFSYDEKPRASRARITSANTARTRSRISSGMKRSNQSRPRISSAFQPVSSRKKVLANTISARGFKATPICGVLTRMLRHFCSLSRNAFSARLRSPMSVAMLSTAIWPCQSIALASTSSGKLEPSLRRCAVSKRASPNSAIRRKRSAMRASFSGVSKSCKLTWRNSSSLP